MTYARARLVFQLVFSALFVFLAAAGAMGLAGRLHVNLFPEMSSFSTLLVAAARRAILPGMLTGVVIAALAPFFGRFFCGWMCPMGALQHLGFVVFAPREAKARERANGYAPHQKVKYVVLASSVACAFFGVVLAGWVDPLALATRFTATVLLPVANLLAHDGQAQTVAYRGALLTAAIFAAAFLLNARVPRFWCRTVCPLGALLSLLSMNPLLRVVRDRGRCTACGRCRRNCHGACRPDGELVASECLMCMNCVDDCPERAIEIRVAPRAREKAEREGLMEGLTLDRRHAAATGFLALLSVGLFKNLRAAKERGFERRIRPPGSLPEEEFLRACIRCGECMNACPTNVLQPAGGEAGPEGHATPVLDMTYGSCEYDCTRCSQVCPTGAIVAITARQKHELGYDRIGTASVDRGRCLPWAYGRECLVCQEVCPVSPKAVFPGVLTSPAPDGKEVTVGVPYVDPDRCIGCGACQYNCPVEDLPAIRVTSIGESRSARRKLIL